MNATRSTLVILAALLLSACGGSEYENADPTVARQIEATSSCDDLLSIANAWNARYESYPEGAARREARETFLLASDRLSDLNCPG